MSNTSMRMQSEFWLLAQAFMLEMAKYHDPELGPNKNNRVALECAVIKKLMDDAFGQEG
jgi:phospholipase C